MSYHIYTTKGIILKTMNFGEADQVLYILTENFGLIFASVKSSRLLLSKLRNFLEEYCVLNVSLIKGRNTWRITNVDGKEFSFSEYPKESRRILAQVSLILLKMITGESPHREIFNIVNGGFNVLKKVKGENDLQSVETLLVLRIMKELGYVVYQQNIDKFFGVDWGEEIIKDTFEKRVTLVGLINKAIMESHL
ncbi:MAG: recombination protein O N-terminal domain-containing protein [Minisyncoccia bacterium]